LEGWARGGGSPAPDRAFLGETRLREDRAVNETTVLIAAVVVFACIAIVALLVFRRHVVLWIKGPLSTAMKLDARNTAEASPPGVKVEGAKSRAGGLTAVDQTGHGADVKDVEVQKDIVIASTPPPSTPPGT